MAFTLANIQTTAKGLLDAAALLPGNALAGITIAVEGTDEPLDVKRSAALQGNGLCVIIEQVEYEAILAGPPGVCKLLLTLPIRLDANPIQNASGTGLQRDPRLVQIAILMAIAGRPASKGPHHFEPAPGVLGPILEIDGALLYATDFTVPVVLSNPQP